MNGTTRDKTAQIAPEAAHPPVTLMRDSDQQPDTPGPVRTIRKYPNRRLYDTAESRYITLTDIRRLVIDRTDFIVIERKSGEDITRSILLQVIAEQEHSGEPMWSRDFLSQLIRSHGGMMQAMIGSYLEQTLKIFATQQRDSRESAREMGNAATLAERNYQRWHSVQDEIYRTLMYAGRGRSELLEED